MSFEYLLVYATTVFVASILPGPSMLLALTHGMKYGARRTIASALGNLSVTLLQASVSMVGLGAILLASENVFNVIKWAGAAYLIYMGVCLWRSPGLAVSAASNPQPNAGTTLRKLYLQGALVTAGNPKAIVFFTAVFPQFIDPAASFAPQFGMLMGIGALIAFGCFMAYAMGGQKIVTLFSKAAFAKYLHKIVGGTFIGTGIGLASSGR